MILKGNYLSPISANVIADYLRARRIRHWFGRTLLCALVLAAFHHSAPLGKAQDTAKLLDAMNAMNEGQKLVEQGNTKSIHQGIKKYEEALRILRAEKMQEGEAAILAALGMAYSTLEEWGNAFDYLNQAIPLARSLKQPILEGTALAVLALTYTSSNQYPKARAAYEQALALFRAPGDEQAQTVKGGLLQGLGMNYVLMGEQEKGFGYLEEALALKRRLRDPSGEAQVLAAIAATHVQLGQGQKALEHATRALSIAQSIPNKQIEALALGVVGSVYRDLGQNEKALEFFNRELSYRQLVDDPSSVSASLRHIAAVYLNMNESEKALSYYNQALKIKRDAGTLNNLGNIYGNLGEFQKSFELHFEALTLARDEQDRTGEAATLTNIGTFYFEMGEPQKAINYYTQALPLMRAMRSPSGEASILGRIGGVLSGADRNEEALAHFTKALELSRGTDRFVEVSALINLARTYSNLGDQPKALDYYNHALPIAREIRNRLALATILNNIGNLYRAQGDTKRALDMYREALIIVRDVRNPSMEVSTLGNMAEAEKSLGHLTEARNLVEPAIDILESIRTRIGSEELRAAYLAKQHGYYEFQIDLLMSLHKASPAEHLDVLALQTSERARARSLNELLLEASANIRQGVDPELLKQERLVQQQINARAFSGTKIRQIPHTAEQAANLAKEIAELTNELQQIKGRIRQTSPRYAALTQFQPLDLEGIQAQLDDDTLLLEYSLGMERSYLWLVSRTEIKSFELEPRKKIESATARFLEVLKTETNIYVNQSGRAQLNTAQRGLSDNAASLSEMLLGKVASKLGQKRLVIAADGILLSLPFSALPDPDTIKQGFANMQPLIMQHEVVGLPSVSVLATLRAEVSGRKAAPNDIAIVADPVFQADDVRVKRGMQNKAGNPSAISVNDVNTGNKARAAAEAAALRGEILERLAASREEADGIAALVSPSKARKALDFDANRQLVNSGELSQYRFVHFATHGILDNVHPELTAIVLSLVNGSGEPVDGFLRVHEIYNLNMPADVVVLSACETGLGKEVRGEGLIGLTRGFMYAGAPRVVVSLWAVKDESTAKLMITFYRGMIKQGKRPAEALRAAQIELMKSEQWRAPHHWAAFVLQGEWR